MKIVVDADACPRGALAICLKLSSRLDIPAYTIASFNHTVQSLNHIVVGDNSQEVDLKVMNLVTKGDVVITQDIGLAAIVLGKGAKVLSPVGREFTQADMPFLLEEREVKAKLRRGGGRTKGPRKRTGNDDTRFEATLKKLLER